MPSVDLPTGARIFYESHGDGFPILAIAPGGLRSSVEKWANAPWNPLQALYDRFRVIGMDQRTAGRSSGPITAATSWATLRSDQLALMDHLGCERFAVIGMCIGGAYALSLATAAPDRVAAAVLMQPIGRADNEAAFREVFDGWARERQEPDLEGFRKNLFGGDFVFAVSREDVKRCEVPLLVLLGNDVYHPEPISREIVRLAPNARLIESWKGEAAPAALAEVRAFLAAHGS